MKKVVYTYGVYDLFHLGHINLFKLAKQYGNYLMVGVVTDAPVQKLKGKNRPIIPFEQRIEIVQNCKYVDEVIIQTVFNPLESIIALIENKFPVHTLVLGEDQTHLSYEDKKYLIRKYNVMIETLPRTFGVSTSDIIKKIKEKKC